jgi:hypothetical protein
MEATLTSHINIPADVLAFADEQGVRAELPAVVAMTQEVFPRATLALTLEDDPEIVNLRHIAIMAKGIDMAVDDAVDATWKWHGRLFACCPAPLVCVFCLAMEGAR